jgi:hypothetical protein
MKIGIVQNKIIYGGRLSVIVGIIEVLNQRGIIPDIITLATEIDSNRIREKYGTNIDFRIRKIYSPLSKLPGEIGIIAFGQALHRVHKEYDHFIDSNNTSFFMPSGIPIFSYVHFPRIARLKSQFLSIHQPQGSRKTWTNKEGAILKAIGLLYSFHTLKENNYVAANSKFTLSYIRKYYPSFQRQIPVIYPPIEKNPVALIPFHEREDAICSIGRFCKGKNQLAQIRLANRLPNLQFHLIGFSEENNGYLDLCKNYVRKNSVTNVHFHENVSFDEKYEIVKTAKFFLHPNVNEPFGIATVEAIFTGCLPLVHNSGGQLEIVPLKELRFDVIDDLEDLLGRIKGSAEYYNTIQKELVHHCQTSFSAEIFKKNIRERIKYFESNYLL